MQKEEINIPVTILSGFLGAGKTTFLNHMLQNNSNTRYAIIENEFGEQGIDNELVIKPDETIVELNNGCLCCTLNDNLYDILNELYSRRTEFDEIIIEATGVAYPTGLAQPFISHPLIKKHFPLSSIICLVDAELIEDQLEDTEEAMSQVTYSDIILINKIDLVSEAYLSKLESKLKTLNPLAEITKGSKNKFPILDYKRNNDKLEKTLSNSNHIISGSNDHLNFPAEKLHSHHHKHTQEVNSHTFIFDTPFDFQRLNFRLSIYLTVQSKGLYRMKGLVWLKEENRQFILQSVGKRFDFTEKKYWQRDDKKQSIIVFIGKNLQREGLEILLKDCLSRVESNVN